jgi:hypothetical protein
VINKALTRYFFAVSRCHQQFEVFITSFLVKICKKVNVDKRFSDTGSCSVNFLLSLYEILGMKTSRQLNDFWVPKIPVYGQMLYAAILLI